MIIWKSISKYSVLGLCALSAGAYAYDYNTSGHAQLSEIKSWPDRIDVYFANDQKHQCSDTVHTNRFLIKAEDKNNVSFILAAFAAGKGVSLAYNCGEDGFPWVEGVRLN